MMRRWLCVGVLMLSLFSCGGGERLRIRIRNDSNQDITKFWLGAGGIGQSTAAYGAISSGDTTPYQSFEPVYANYSNFNFITADGGKYVDVILPEEHIGSAELPPGSYTFGYDIVGGKAVLRLIQDK